MYIYRETNGQRVSDPKLVFVIILTLFNHLENCQAGCVSWDQKQTTNWSPGLIANDSIVSAISADAIPLAQIRFRIMDISAEALRATVLYRKHKSVLWK